MKSDFESELGRLTARLPASRKADCPADLEWINLVLDAVDPPRQEWLLAHAVECEHCSLRLRQAAQAREDADAQENEAAAIQDSPRTKVKPINSGRSHAPWNFPKWSWAAMLFVLGSVTVWLALRPGLERAKQEIASSYQQARPFGYRVADVPWGPVDQKRGPGEIRLISTPKGDKPEQLSWAARAVLWEGDYDQALVLLERARARGGDSPGLLNNAAVAHAAKGDTEQAIRVLQGADKQYPGYAPILFNLALLLSAQGKQAEAQLILQKLAHLETDENWRREEQLLIH